MVIGTPNLTLSTSCNYSLMISNHYAIPQQGLDCCDKISQAPSWGQRSSHSKPLYPEIFGTQTYFSHRILVSIFYTVPKLALRGLQWVFREDDSEIYDFLINTMTSSSWQTIASLFRLTKLFLHFLSNLLSIEFYKNIFSYPEFSVYTV